MTKLATDFGIPLYVTSNLLRKLSPKVIPDAFWEDRRSVHKISAFVVGSTINSKPYLRLNAFMIQPV
jgi:hypothetical protein